MSDDPFADWIVYGPYPDRKHHGRLMMTLVRRDKSQRTSMPYPRYAMAIQLGRWLTRNEHVDHIDGDRSNNSLSNFQILTPQQNNSKDKTKPLLKLTCPYCGSQFERKRKRVREAWGGVVILPTCCSRRCSGLLQYQLGRGRVAQG